MEVSKPIELMQISEIKILQNVRLIHHFDLNPINSKNNLKIHFEISGEVKGSVDCFLCLDNQDLSSTDKNYIIPLFVESMNILVGRQITIDTNLSHFKIRISPPKINMISKELNSNVRPSTHKYFLELEDKNFVVLIDYNLETYN